MSDDSARPRTVNYCEYIQSEAWQVKRREALARAGDKCQLCGGRKRMNVHHNTYERLGDELPEDLVALCGGCHEAFHAVRDERTKKKVRAKAAERGVIYQNRVPLMRMPPGTLPPQQMPAQKPLHRRQPGIELVPPGRRILVTITKEYLASLITPANGLTSRGATLVGLRYPLTHGWKGRVIGTTVEVDEDVLKAEVESNRHKAESMRANLPPPIFTNEGRVFTPEQEYGIAVDWLAAGRGPNRIPKLADRYGCSKSMIRRIVRKYVRNPDRV